MYILDLIIAVLLAYALFKGLKNGFIASVVSFVALIVGVYIALRFSFFMRDFLAINTSWNPKTVTITAFIGTFLLVLIILFFLGKTLTKIAQGLALGFVNKLFGAFFEGLKMICILSVLFNVFQKINYNHLIVSKEKLDESIFYRPIENTAKLVFPLMEKWYQLALSETVDQLQKNNKNQAE
ncbi:CvpA family protein [Myroides sp. JBRI-B21084]|uniref:CvpA family protein n=1 Tax=Myroides sp. JBRI-B21084 TaxID=3119977 RepID=UPI0026E1944F|nr:CvpA family protein [Paenimyroides cloacae]WKW46060.1 CvpA family protein [Paenimyroides cloacae]